MGIAEFQTCLANTCTEVTNAKNEAVTAKTEAVVAKTDAETAASNAELAKNDAETAASNAESAKVDAQNAQSQAEAAAVAAGSAVPSGTVYPIEVQATSDGQTTFTLNAALQSIVMLVKGNGAVIVSSKRSVSGTTMTIDSTANIVNGEILAGWGVTQ